MLDPILSRWLDVQAQALDVGSCDPQEVLPRLAEANILKIGVPTQLGGLGGDVAGGGGDHERGRSNRLTPIPRNKHRMPLLRVKKKKTK